MKRKKTRPRFPGESFLGEWALTVSPEKGGYVVTKGESRRVYPNFDDWAESNGLATTQRQLELERDHFGTVLFLTKEDAVAAAMELSAPDAHKKKGDCNCTQCVHYRNEAQAREALKRPTLEL